MAVLICFRLLDEKMHAMRGKGDVLPLQRNGIIEAEECRIHEEDEDGLLRLVESGGLPKILVDDLLDTTRGHRVFSIVWRWGVAPSKLANIACVRTQRRGRHAEEGVSACDGRAGAEDAGHRCPMLQHVRQEHGDG